MCGMFSVACFGMCGMCGICGIWHLWYASHILPGVCSGISGRARAPSRRRRSCRCPAAPHCFRSHSNSSWLSHPSRFRVVCSGPHQRNSRSAATGGTVGTRTFRHCQNADTPSPVLLKHQLEWQGGCSRTAAPALARWGLGPRRRPAGRCIELHRPRHPRGAAPAQVAATAHCDTAIWGSTRPRCVAICCIYPFRCDGRRAASATRDGGGG